MNLSKEEFTILKLSRIKNIKKARLFEFFIRNEYNPISTLYFIENFYIKKYPQIKIPENYELIDEIDKMKLINGKFLFYKDLKYPSLLKNTESPPLVFSYLGNKDILQQNCIAIVETRNPTKKGISITKKIIKIIENFITISGMAKGIDSIVHEESLKFGTIGVLGSGLNNIYPKENEILLKNIIQNNGIIISEFHIDEPPIASNFPRRNRIIAGIANLTIVTQASLKSGTLITARLANEYNRDVYVIPGDVEDESFSGNNYLISENLGIIIPNINKLKDFLKHNNNLQNFTSS